MYLRELRINGFKSFADRTPVRLARGVTCIVGPNGCGKSNIVDAIRWVLGEQSAKALRGGKMQDVIFQGTDRRQPLPSCEVALTFADCEAELGTAFNEVEVSRRVDREGSGDYYLNGKRCRLKDIQQLFMDTGIGRSGYSFMMQGQIDQILSSNPQERRTIFEEAAGITKYKAQRKEALNKLALTEQNLARVTDVIEQMTRQLGSLKRQASKALRYQRLKHRLTHLDLAQLAHQYELRQKTITEFEEKAAGLRGAVSADKQAQQQAEVRLTALKGERAQSLETVQSAQQAVFDLRSEKESAENRIQFAGVRQQDLAERMGAAEREVAGMREQVTALAEKRQSAAEAKAAIEAQVSGADQFFAERQRAFDELNQRLAAADRSRNQTRAQLSQKEGTLSRLRTQVTSAEVALRTFEVKHAALADAVHEGSEKLAAAEARVEELGGALGQKEAAVTEAKTRVEKAREGVAARRASFRELQKEIADTDRELAKASARLSTLEDMQARFEGFSAGAKAILQGKLGDVLPPGQYQPLSAIIEAEPRYTPALETLLGASAEAIVLDEAIDRVGPVLRTLDENDLGRACLQVSVATRKIDLGDFVVPDWLMPAAKVICPKNPRNEEMAKLVAMFFEGCYFCDDLERFLAFWNQHYHFDFLFVATNHDELVSHRGLVYGGRQRTSESSFIQRQAQIRRLHGEVTERNEKLTTLQEQVMGLNEGIETAEKALESAQAQQSEAQRELTTLLSELKQARLTVDSNRRTLDSQQRDLAKMENERGEASSRYESSAGELTATERAVEELRSTVEEQSTTVAKLQEERDARKDGLAEARLALSEQKQQLQLHQRGVVEADTQRQALETRIVQRTKETEQMAAQRNDLEGDQERDQARRAELEHELADASEELSTAREAVNAADQQIEVAERELAQLRNASTARQQQLNSYEVRLAEEHSQARFVADKVRGEYEREVAQVRWRQQLWLADEEFETKVDLADLEEDDGGEVDLTPRLKRERGEPTADDLRRMEATDWKQIGAEVKDLRKRISALGAINLVAVEEYSALKEQYDFRKSQSDDIWKAKDELLKTIDEINTTSQQLFQETFEQVRNNFTYTFEKLFAGGSGDLELIAAEDVLDSGIEIIARPPGTKMKTLTLLSGGQRTMTALALLFAIYMVKPSPFAVLDELDAPLDDINVGRFTEIVKEFVQYSQFLIVTHNKRTMAAADSIFGVTMQERGVTKLFSMRFSKDAGEAVHEAVVEG